MGFLLVVLIVVGAIWLAGQFLPLLFALIIAGLTGYFASRILGGDGAGTLGNVVLGLFGGVVGNVVLNLLNLGNIGNTPLIGGILVGILGAVLIIMLARAFGFKAFAR